MLYEKAVFLLTMLAFLALIASAITQTGNLIVTVASEEGQLLPGATVVLSSPSLMGTRTQTTTANGKATFRNLPPGDYSVEVKMDCFQTYRQGGIEIRLQKTSKIEVAMKLGQAREVIEVVGTGPIVDTSSNTIAAEFDFDNYINHMPTYRHYTSIVGLAGGVIPGNNVSSAGGGIYSNVYLIDGTYSMDPRTHTWGNQMNVDTISDISAMRAGSSAEYGHGMGMVMNIVSKSGSNEISGIGRLEIWRKLWNDESENNPTRSDDNSRAGMQGEVWNISGGGPLYPDMVWWYIGYSNYQRDTAFNRYLNINDLGALTPATRTYYGHFLSAKGTVQIGEDIKAVIYYREDPIDLYNVEAGNYVGPQNLPSADMIQKQGGDNTLGSVSLVLTETMFMEAAVSLDRTNLLVVAQGEDPSGEGKWTATQTTGPYFRSKDGWRWGGMRRINESKRYNDSYRFSTNYMADTESLGDHDVKLGVEWLDAWTNVRLTAYPSNEYIYTGTLTGVGYDNVPYLQRTLYFDRLPAAETHGKCLSIYLQDALELSDSLTLNLGLRTDMSMLYNNQNEKIHEDGLLTALAPRAGFAYDLSGSVLRGSYGRYYDTYTNYLMDDFNWYTTPERREYYEPLDGVNGRNGWKLIKSWTVGSTTVMNELDPELTPQYVDEFTLGFDYLISETMAVGITGIYRSFQDAVTREDIDGDTYYYWTNLETAAHGTTVKTFWGAILEFRKRPTEDNLFLSASLTYENTEGYALSWTRAAFHGNPIQNDDNSDLYWGNQVGYNWYAKAQATYFFPNNWYIGLQGNWIQGLAPTSTQNVAIPIVGTVTHLPNGLVDMERVPDDIFFDLQFGIEQQIELPFDVPFWDDNVLLGVYIDIFNIFSAQQATNRQTLVSNVAYRQENAWRGARNYELGFRIEF